LKWTKEANISLS